MKNTDDIIASLGRDIARSESMKTKVVGERVEMVVNDFELAKNISSGKSVRVSIELHKPYRSHGSITISGKEITITDTKVFCEIASRSHNLDFWPKNNGVIDVVFSYNGLMEEE